MKDWWEQLASRERLVVQYGSLALFLFIILWFGLRPGLKAISSLEQQVAANQSLLAWMTPSADKITSLRHHQTGAKKLPVAQLLPTLQDDLQATELAQGLEQISLVGEDEVALSFSKVNFDIFISWYTEMVRRYGVVITNLSVVHLDNAGAVKLEARLR